MSRSSLFKNQTELPQHTNNDTLEQDAYNNVEAAIALYFSNHINPTAEQKFILLNKFESTVLEGGRLSICQDDLLSLP